MNVHGSKWIRPEKRLAIYLRDGFRCAYCLRDLSTSLPAELTLDHLQPRSLGGSNCADNLILACRSCNSSRGTKLWTEVCRYDGSIIMIGLIVAGLAPLNIELARSIIENRQDVFVADVEGVC